MPTGTVKWYSESKGYGFIKPDGRDKDVFVHVSEVEKSGIDTLTDGDKLEFDIVNNRGRDAAENLKLA
ncbi:MAG: cold-shock protein [Saprospiraceae bacterium]